MVNRALKWCVLYIGFTDLAWLWLTCCQHPAGTRGLRSIDEVSQEELDRCPLIRNQGQTKPWQTGVVGPLLAMIAVWILPVLGICQLLVHHSIFNAPCTTGSHRRILHRVICEPVFWSARSMAQRVAEGALASHVAVRCHAHLPAYL